jgi:polyvinyl alcohol dehydrogenase (cytochrome)
VVTLAFALGALARAAGPAPVSGAWGSYGHDLANTRFNGQERAVDSRTVRRLAARWSKTGIEGVVGTPTVAGADAYFADLTGNVWAVRLSSGRVIWRTQIAPGVVAGTAVQGRYLYAASGNTLYALERSTGTVRWKAITNANPFAQISASPVVIGREVVVGTASFEVFIAKTTYTFQGSIGAFDARSGRRLWNFVTTPNDARSGPGEGVWSTPAVDRKLGLLYIGTGQNLAPPAGPLEDSILAIDYRTGRLAWSMQATHGDVFSMGYPNGFDYDLGASPNLFRARGRELVGDGSKDGAYYALDARTGKLVWKTQVAPGGPFGGVLGSAALADGRLIVPANVGNTSPEAAEVVALDPRSGKAEWTHPVPGHILGPVSAVPGVAFVASDTGALVALGTRSGRQLWSFAAPAQSAAGPSIVGSDVLWGYGFTLFGPPGQGGIIDFRPRPAPYPRR